MSAQAPLEELRELLTPRRLERIDFVVRHRHRTLTVVVEDLRDPHNQAAVLRTAEGLGLMSAHVIDTGAQTFQPNRGVTKDADKWLTVRRYSDPAPCLDELKAAGFAIYAGELSASSVSLYDLDVCRPCAFVFGNEHRGVSPAIRERADQLFLIPMRGFVESFNVSVAAGICMAHAVRQREVAGMVTDLDPSEREALRADYERRSLGKRVINAATRMSERESEGSVAVEQEQP
jgi:tRNA (guanosine-2'-O-)-methyltransferase